MLGGLLLSQATLADDLDRQQIYQQISELRARAGLNPLERNPQLEAAAQDHANYLLQNGQNGHFQDRGRRGYTGKTATERTAWRGYASRDIKENVSSGQHGYTASLTGLMKAVYHRLAFLSPDIDQIGLANSGSGKDSRYVYDMGNKALDQLCLETKDRAAPRHAGRYYLESCNFPARIEARRFEASRAQIARGNPLIIVWPVDGSHGVPPAFFDEQPDPLPDYEVSGNPVTIQVNLTKARKATLTNFELFDAQSGERLRETRVLGEHNDPNKHLTAGQWALFPLQRLQWSHRYRVKATLNIDGAVKHLDWQFRTRDLPGPRYDATHRVQRAEVESAKSIFIYAPPSAASPRLKQISWQYPQFSHVNSEFVDGNTLRVTPHGEAGDQIRLQLDPQREFILTIVAK